MERIKNRKKITQRDVAKYAGLSTGTVSRVINNIPHVEEPTRKKILEAIEALGYIPNQAAQALAYGKTNNILLLILDREPIFPSTWQYELPILQGINNYFQTRGYILQIEMLNFNDRTLIEKLHENLLRGRSFDGLIVLTSWDLGSKLIRKIDAYRIPAIFIGNGPYTYDKHPVGTAILFDNYKVIHEAYFHLWHLGHRRIAFVKGDETQLHSNIRLTAFLDAAKKSKAHAGDIQIYDGNFSVQSGYRALCTFMESKAWPTAVICANDLMAIGLMKAAADLEIDIPHKLSVIGFDAIEISEYLSPPLTTIRVPAYDLGSKSAAMLVNQIEQGAVRETLVLPASFIVRQSTARAS
jgi:LacI family transcriptional regulator